jgi:hypothetical protein
VLQEWFLAGTAPVISAATMYEMHRGHQVLSLPADYAAWCAGPQNRAGAVAKADGFRIVFPKDGAAFVFNPNLPASQQVLVPRSTDPSCEWFANGKKIGSGQFLLQPGTWTLTARSGLLERTIMLRVE